MSQTKSVRWAFNFKKWIPTQNELLLATSCIQNEEKDRISKFVFKKDFKSSLVGRLMIRKFINYATKIPYNLIKVQRDEKGKPIFDASQSNIEISFNVSHQGDFTVLSGEIGGCKVGVDVMKIEYSGGKNLEDFFRIMNRQFSPLEWSQINNADTSQAKLTTFCRSWCLKESYVKAIGVGITINLQEIVFKFKTPNIYKNDIITDTELFVRGKKEPWHFEEMLLNDDHVVATALLGSKNEDYEPHKFEILSFEELVKGAIPLLQEDVEYCNSFLDKRD